MSWTAPQVDRLEPPGGIGELPMLMAWLDFHRLTLLHKCVGLNAEQLRRRSVPPSSLSLLGLVRHMTDVERGWFRRRVGREEVDFLYSDETDPDGDFDNVDGADAEQNFIAFAQEIELARAAIQGRPLEETFFHAQQNAELDLRWVYLHMIEEYARHNGHADLLREQLDGVTGD